MKTKTIVLMVALLLTTLMTKAQNKYEFMAIIYAPSVNELTISLDGKEFLKEEVKLEKNETSPRNMNPLLKKVSEYQDSDWELLSFNPSTQSSYNDGKYIAFLRKKKADKK
jgi:hypothetical protein